MRRFNARIQSDSPRSGAGSRGFPSKVSSDLLGWFASVGNSLVFFLRSHFYGTSLNWDRNLGTWLTWPNIFVVCGGLSWLSGHCTAWGKMNWSRWWHWKTRCCWWSDSWATARDDHSVKQRSPRVEKQIPTTIFYMKDAQLCLCGHVSVHII